MKLVALFCRGHYLFNDDVLINFGGEYIYDFFYKDDEKVIEIKREKNSNHIENFFGENISLLSSIVGSNGSGKTYSFKY
jgi:predicted site-specific integrase-resolvase